MICTNKNTDEEDDYVYNDDWLIEERVDDEDKAFDLNELISDSTSNLASSSIGSMARSGMAEL